jgi:hypothetical protein
MTFRCRAAMLLMAAWAGVPAQDFHTSPACWTAPRIFHAGPPSAEFANRLHLIETPASVMPGEALVSPGGRTRLWLRQPDTGQPPPWGAALVIDRGHDRHRTLLVEQIGAPLAPRWLNERWVFLRVVWGRIQFSDIVLDTIDGTLRYHEVARDGSTAFEQFQAACRGRCPCDPETLPAPGDPARFTVQAAIPTARPGAQAMIGLLLLPTVFGPPETGGVVAADHPTPVEVYAEPDIAAAPMTALAALEHFEHREHAYEGAAAVVYERRPGWYSIGLRGQALPRGWVRAEQAGTYFAAVELLRDRLAFLNAHWDGHLWLEPAAGPRTSEPSLLVANGPPDASTEIAVEVLDIRRIGEGWWLEVETLNQSPCNVRSPRVVDRGWIPAYAESGALVGGYYSRGC